MDIEELPKGFNSTCWQVHKFGGTSVADANCFLKVATIIEEQIGIIPQNNEDSSISASNSFDKTMLHSSNLAVVVSAMGGKPKTTDLLLQSVTAAADRDDEQVDACLEFIQNKHYNCIETLFLNKKVKNTNDNICDGSESKSPNENKALEVVHDLKSTIAKDLNDIRDILKTVSLMKWQAKRISELVSGYGETWSTQILTFLLTKRENERREVSAVSDGATNDDNDFGHLNYFRYIDARRVITIDEDAIQDGAVCWDISADKLKSVYKEESLATYGTENERKNSSMHLVITGYVASNTHSVATTLQRDGSDYSAAIMGRLLQSALIAIWTDVDGVLSADPRRVPHSYVLPEVSFNEAMELAYFGAKVIHPKTMQPAIMGSPQIPIYIRNTFNSSFRGSRIFTSSTTHTDRDRCVCGFSSIDKMAMVNVEGSGMVGVKGVARRLFGTLESMGINVVLISQASSEHSITFATTMQQAKDAKIAIEEEFHKEIKQSHISTIDVVSPCSIIAAVGDGMHFTTGVAGRFFSALGDAKINILAISQGSSERNISAVVFEAESTRALRAVHAAFRLSQTTVRVGIIGMNEIGMSLLKLLETQRNKYRKSFQIELQVCAIMKDGSSSDIVTLKSKTGSSSIESISTNAYNSLSGGSLMLGASAATVSFQSSDLVQVKANGLDGIGDIVFSEDNANSVIFDCTADSEVGSMHIKWLKTGINVVTANSTALAGPSEVRNEIKNIERERKANYLREVTVGGALPVISTIRDLINSGDRIRRLDGVLSVTMSYVMYRIAPPPGNIDCTYFDESSTKGAYRRDMSISPSGDGILSKPCSFSQAMNEAAALGLTEEDPIKDMNNECSGRCLMVLARELGMDDKYDLPKILSNSESLVPNGQQSYHELVKDMDLAMQKRVEEAAKKKCVPRQICSIDVHSEEITIKMMDVPETHVFATLQPSCECVRFFTQRHKTYPLVVQGPSAGADSTASALLADFLNSMRKTERSGPGEISKSTSNSSFLSMNQIQLSEN